MKKRTTIGGMFAILFVSLAVIGCGGTGAGIGDPGGGGGTASPFAGRWSGTFEDQIPVNGSGPISMNISRQGNWTATGRNNRLHTDITGSGSIDALGNLSGTMSNGVATGNVSGQLALSDNSMTGPVFITNSQGFSQVNVELSR